MSRRLIIPCAGEQKGWGNFLNTRKYLAPVFGEKLLHRTLRKFHAADPSMWLTVLFHPDAEIDLPKLPNAHIAVEVPPSYMLGEENKLMSSRRFWNPTGRTIIAFGDVFFSDAAIEAIMAANSNQIEWFGRSGPGTLTNWPFSEIFAISIPANKRTLLLYAIRAMKRAVWEGRIEEGKAWHCYRHLIGVPLDSGIFGSTNFTEIDDLTQDFDCPECYLRWRDACGSFDELPV